MLNSRPRMRKLAWAACGLVIWAAPLAGGTADRPYTLLCAALCACAALLAIASRRTSPPPLLASWFQVFVAVALVATLLQALPLPPALRAFLAPGSDAELRQLIDGLGGPEPQRRYLALSLDVGATLNEAVRLAGYLCLLVALSELLTSEKRARALLQNVYGAAALVAGLGICVGLRLLPPLPSPLGVFGEGATRAIFSAGLANSNHLAALMGLGALLLLDALLVADQALAVSARLRRGGLLALLLACNLVLLGTLSRAGITVWLAAQLFRLAWHFKAHRRRGALTFLPVAALCVIALLLLFSQWESAWTALRLRFADATVPKIVAPGGKLHAWREAWPLLRGHLPFGIGRGAFENAFQHVHTLSGRLRFVYLENEWLQAVVDWGVPTAVALFFLLGLALRDAVLRSRDAKTPPQQRRQGRVAAIGLFALAVHNLFDFNLEVGGVAVMALALCAVCQKPRFVVPRWAALGLALATLVSTPWVATRWPSHDEDGAALRALCQRRETRLDEILSHARAASLRHPLDAYLPALVAARLLAEPGPDAQAAAVTWTNRALVANPREILARHTAAILLLRAGHREQGLLLLRGALADSDGQQRRSLLQSLLVESDSAEELYAILPDAAAIDELLDLLGGSTPPRWPLLRALTAKLLAERPTQDLSVAVWLGRSALALRDPASAATAAGALLQAPAYVPGLLFADLADLLGDAGRADEAEALLRKALERGDGAEILLSLARLALRRAAVDEGRALLERALSRSEAAALTARIHEVYGELEARAGNPYQATEHRRESARLRVPVAEQP